MSSTNLKIEAFTEKALNAPLHYSGAEGRFYIKQGLIKFFDEDGQWLGSCFAVIYDLLGNLIGRVHGWNREALWVEDVDPAVVSSWVDLGESLQIDHL